MRGRESLRQLKKYPVFQGGEQKRKYTKRRCGRWKQQTSRRKGHSIR